MSPVRSNPRGQMAGQGVAPQLPADVPAERAVLGAIILNNDALNVALALVQPCDFFLDAHQRIFSRMLALKLQEHGIDLVTLRGELERFAELNAVGGEGYLAQLIDGVPRVGHVRHYAQAVKDKSLLRRLICASEAIQQQAIEGADDPQAVLARAAQLVDGLQSEAAETDGLCLFSPAEIIDRAKQSRDFLIWPIAVPGVVFELDGMAKLAGKTTFCLGATRAALAGETFLGQPTRPVRALFISEENYQTLAPALERAGLTGDAPDLRVIPFTQFGGRPWADTATLIERACEDYAPNFLAIDTFFGVVQASPEQENDSGFCEQAIRPIRRLAGRRNLAVVVTRHERKSGGEVGISGRGSSGLSGAVDIVGQLRRLPSEGPARRRLSFVGRIGSDTLEIELLEDGRYVPVEGSGAVKRDLAMELFDNGQTVRQVASALKISPTAAQRLRKRWQAFRCTAVPPLVNGRGGTATEEHEPAQARNKPGTEAERAEQW